MYRGFRRKRNKPLFTALAVLLALFFLYLSPCLRSSLQACVKCAQVIWGVNKHACHKPNITGLPVFITFSERKDINRVDRALAELNSVEKKESLEAQRRREVKAGENQKLQSHVTLDPLRTKTVNYMF